MGFLKTLIVVCQTIVVWQRSDAFYSALINSLTNVASDKTQAKEAAEKEDLEDLINLINEKRNGAKVCLHLFWMHARLSVVAGLGCSFARVIVQVRVRLLPSAAFVAR